MNLCNATFEIIPSRNSACAYQSPESCGRLSDNFSKTETMTPRQSFTARQVSNCHGDCFKTTLEPETRYSCGENEVTAFRPCVRKLSNNPPTGMAPFADATPNSLFFPDYTSQKGGTRLVCPRPFLLLIQSRFFDENASHH